MKKNYSLFFILVLATNFSFAQTQTRLWTSVTIDSVADYFNLSDMAVDTNGNTYLSGYEVYPGDEYYQTHLILLKVNAAGVLEWKRNFNNKKDSIDEAIALATDAAGNVYVTGKRIDTFCNICTYQTKISDVITIKYNAAGNRVWLNRFHDADYILAAPSDITIAENGAIFITGNERRYVPELGTYVSNLLIQKININGKTTWVKKMNEVVGHSACFDKENNIIVAGASDPGNLYQTQKPMVLKFKPNGNLLWSNIFNEFNKYGRFYFVKCDSLNNIYTNGQTDTLTFFNNPRIVTVKYNPVGQQQWFKKEDNHTTTMPHVYGDFTADAAGNCYLTGYIEKSGIDDDWLTVKYNNEGVKKWSTAFDGGFKASDKPVGIAVDKKGNTYVTGYVYTAGGYNSIATVAYSKTGSLLGSDIVGAGKKSTSFATGIGIDKNNNVYTGGTIGIYNNTYPASIVIKYGLKQTPSIAEAPEVKITNDLKLFPNPVVNTLNVVFTSFVSAKNYKLSIYDVSGNAVLLKLFTGAGKTMNLNIDVSRLKQGVYAATISDGINAVSKTFIKE